MQDIREIRLDVQTLARYKGLSVKELAKACGISEGHLKNVSVKKAKMTGFDLQQLSDYTGIPMENILVE